VPTSACEAVRGSECKYSGTGGGVPCAVDDGGERFDQLVATTASTSSALAYLISNIGKGWGVGYVVVRDAVYPRGKGRDPPGWLDQPTLWLTNLAVNNVYDPELDEIGELLPVALDVHHRIAHIGPILAHELRPST
jgi:hypothetical protein